MVSAQSDGLLDLLGPAWQALIAGCLLIVLVLGLHRLAQRGPTRMTHGVVVTGLLIVVFAVLGALIAQLR